MGCKNTSAWAVGVAMACHGDDAGHCRQRAGAGVMRDEGADDRPRQQMLIGRFILVRQRIDAAGIQRDKEVDGMRQAQPLRQHAQTEQSGIAGECDVRLVRAGQRVHRRPICAGHHIGR